MKKNTVQTNVRTNPDNPTYNPKTDPDSPDYDPDYDPTLDPDINDPNQSPEKQTSPGRPNPAQSGPQNPNPHLVSSDPEVQRIADHARELKSRIGTLEAQAQADHRALESATKGGNQVLITAANTKVAITQRALDNARAEVPAAMLNPAAVTQPTQNRAVVTSKTIATDTAAMDQLNSLRSAVQTDKDILDKARASNDPNQIRAAEEKLAQDEYALNEAIRVAPTQTPAAQNTKLPPEPQQNNPGAPQMSR